MKENHQEIKLCIAFTLYNPENRNLNKFIEIAQENDFVYIYDNSPSISFDFNELKKVPENLVYMSNGYNDGMSKALNQSCNFALSKNCTHILFLDQDSMFTNKEIKELLNHAIDYEIAIRGSIDRVAIYAPNIICEYVDEAKYLEKLNYEEREWLVTSGSLLDLNVFKEIGEFDENLFIDYVDTDYCIRLRKSGYKLIQFARPIMMHSLGITKDTLGYSFYEHSPIRNYYIFRNKLYILTKYFSMKRLFITFLSSFKQLLKIILLESEKLEKIQFILLAIKDFKNNKMKGFSE